MSNINPQKIAKPGRKAGVSLDSGRGERIAEVLCAIFGKASDSSMARELGMKDGRTIAGWIAGSSIDNNALAKLDELGADVRYILTGRPMPTGACAHGKLCERLPTALRLGAALVEELCSMDEPARERADSILRDVQQVMQLTNEEPHGNKRNSA
jgi:hypothetical protein